MVVQRWRIRVPGGLNGKRIEIVGLAESRTDALVRVQRLDGSEQIGRLLPGSQAFDVKPSPNAFEVATSYTIIGIEHILLGFDHLLFVLALVMIVRDTRRLLVTITAFTVAHSITLSLATLGVVSVPGPPVEAIIALSIVFVALEILHRRAGRLGLAARKPWLVAFGFGLLHGLGFAGALAEVGLPRERHSAGAAVLQYRRGNRPGAFHRLGAGGLPPAPSDWRLAALTCRDWSRFRCISSAASPATGSSSAWPGLPEAGAG